LKRDRTVIVTADDFGLSLAVNEAVEQAYQNGVLTSASLMVAGDAAEDAVQRARANPGLAVGLHLVVIEGPSILRPKTIPNLVDSRGQFPSNQLKLGLKYFFSPRIKRQLAAEITAQFAAFAATGLHLDHANAHKHMHLHPTVARMMLQIGRCFGLRAVRVPAEPPAVMRAAGADMKFGNHALYAWSHLLRAQARRYGMVTNDAVFGLHWSGHMTSDRLARLTPHLPPGINELYFHPASRRDQTLQALMPDYQHEAELETLTGSVLRDLRCISFSKMLEDKKEVLF
jgi:hopanoid biosynthesis associated protein HpnK